MVNFDVVGSTDKAVAIVEIPENKNGKEIARKIMKKNKNIKSVLKKSSERTSDYRLWKLELVEGDENTEVIHKEHGYLLKINPRKVYFSPREGTERQRIASQVKENEIIMLMFAGIGAYAVAIAKKQPNVKKIIAIELNPEGVQYMKENIRINKISHLVLPIEGDVREKARDFFGKCDRVIMPLPLEAENFLDIAVKCLKKNGIINFYSISSEKDFNDVIEKIKKRIKNFKILNKRIVLPYAPSKYKVCIDIVT